MPTPFQAAADAVKRSGARVSAPSDKSVVFVFVGKVIALGYRVNGEEQSRPRLQARSSDASVAAAAGLGRAHYPETCAAVEVVPVDDDHAAQILEKAAELDRLCLSLMTSARVLVEVNKEATTHRKRREAAAEAERLVRTDLADEVFRLLDEGLLDDSNVLAQLKRLAERIRGLRAEAKE